VSEHAYVRRNIESEAQIFTPTISSELGSTRRSPETQDLQSFPDAVSRHARRDRTSTPTEPWT
jgi:hypothetical protein